MKSVKHLFHLKKNRLLARNLFCCFMRNFLFLKINCYDRKVKGFLKTLKRILCSRGRFLVSISGTKTGREGHILKMFFLN